MKSFIRSITTKYIIIGLLIIGLTVSFTTLSFWFTNRIKDDARRINLAGKGRMLNYEMAWLLNPTPPQKAIAGQDEKKTETLNYLEGEMSYFEEVLYALRDGSKKYKLGPLSQGNYLTMPHRKMALDELDSIIEKWRSEIRPMLTKAVEGDPGAFRQYNIMIRSYVDEIDSFVNYLEQNYKKEFMFYGRLRFTAIALSALVFISLIFFTRKTLVRPILRLKDAAGEIEKGNLGVRVEVETMDEIGELGNAFNSMAQTRKEAEAEINRNYYLQRVLNSILHISLEPISLEEQLERMIDLIFLIPWVFVESKCCIFLIEDDPEVLVMKVQRRFTEPLLSTCRKVPFGRCLCGQAASTGEVVFADCVDDRHETRFQDMPPHGHLCIPIQTGSKLLGVINLYVKSGHKRNPREEEFLTAIANTLAGTIERKQAEEAKQRSEEHFRDVIESIFKFVPEGLLVFTDKLNLFKQNKAFQDIVQKYAAKLNYTEEELTEIILAQIKNRIASKDQTEIRISNKER